ncbi:MAG: hypothetical protein C0418_00880 [Coriobacteriaceae bacterium]|nr:hypothetical protein [Coriobacteriaceae bacterium]
MARPTARDSRGTRPARPGYVEREHTAAPGRWAWLAFAFTVIVVVVVFGWRYLGDGGLTEILGPGDPVPGGVLRFGMGDPAGLDPRLAQDPESRQAVQLLFDGLTALDPVTGEVVPAVATSWSSEESATVFRFALSADARFHDGTPVTAVDFKYAWERLVDPKVTKGVGPLSYMLEIVEGYEELTAGKATELSGLRVIDDVTFEVRLRESYADLPYLVAHPALSPVPRDRVRKDPAAFAKRPVGNGPFKLDSPWRKGVGAKLTRFDAYHGRPAYLDGVQLVAFDDDGAAWRALQTEKIDFASVPVSADAEALEALGKSENGYTAAPGKRFLFGAECGTYYIACNLKDPLIAKAEVRRALSLAIDRAAIGAEVYGGTRRAADGIVAPGAEGYREGAWPYSRFDVAAAKKALAKAGYPNGNGMPEVRLAYNSGSENEAVAKATRTQWAAIGIRTRLEAAEFSEHLDRADQGDFQLVRLGLRPDRPTHDAFLTTLFAGSSGDNVSGYSVEEVDAALATARATADAEERLSIYRGVDKKVASDLPVIPMLFYGHHHGVSRRVANLTLGSSGFAALEKTWLLKGGK